MSDDRPLDATRKWLKNFIAIAAVASIGCFIATLFVDDLGRTLLSSVASASLSVALALLVTEFVVKPVLAKDLVAMAHLSKRIDLIGLRDLCEESKVDWDRFYAESDSIWVTAVDARYWFTRDSRRLLNAASERQVTVDIALPDDAEFDFTANLLGRDPAVHRSDVASVSRDLQQAWTDGGSIRPGSRLTVHSYSGPVRTFLASNGRTAILGVSAPIPNASDAPLYLVIDLSNGSDVGRWLGSSIASAKSKVQEVPIWESPRP